jgi:hypothetical protein
MDLCATPAVDLARLIRSRELSATELLTAALARIDQANPAINAMLLAGMCGSDPGLPLARPDRPADFLDLRSASLRGLRVAWTFDLGDLPVQPEVRAVLSSMLERLDHGQRAPGRLGAGRPDAFRPSGRPAAGRPLRRRPPPARDRRQRNWLALVQGCIPGKAWVLPRQNAARCAQTCMASAPKVRSCRSLTATTPR